MAKRAASKAVSDAVAQPADDTATIVDALRQVTQVLHSINAQMQQAAAAASAVPTVSVAGTEVNTWDDPFSEAAATLNPQLAMPAAVAVAASGDFAGLRINIVEPPVPPARYAPGTPEFRYWVAGEALARGVDFWGGLLPAGTTWSTSNPMRVTLVEAGEDLNANYSRPFGLRFFRQRVGGVEIFSSESPDVVCHELGHAVLDAIRPELFNVANVEAAAFHESFGDMSAILCALQIPLLGRTVIAETNGRLNVNSRLSRVAEQLGWGIRQLSPTAVDRDSLRNAANRFFYRDPDELPPSAPSNLLSTEEHSFSRVFTGAFLDALARIFTARGGTTETDLAAVGRDVGRLLIDAVHGATISIQYFSQVAAAVVQADQARFGGRHRSELTGAFVEHGILSVASVIDVANGPVPKPMDLAPQPTPSAAGALRAATLYSYDDRSGDEAFRDETPELPLRTISINGAVTLDVHAATEAPRFAVRSATIAARPDAAVGIDDDARLFVEGLIQRRQVDLGRTAGAAIDLQRRDSVGVTHSVVSEDGRTVLKRNHFNCRCGCNRLARPAASSRSGHYPNPIRRRSPLG